MHLQCASVRKRQAIRLIVAHDVVMAMNSQMTWVVIAAADADAWLRGLKAVANAKVHFGNDVIISHVSPLFVQGFSNQCRYAADDTVPADAATTPADGAAALSVF